MAGNVLRTGRPKPQQLTRVVQEVADSVCFAKAPALRRLLLYLWEHYGEDISEYAIAVDALGKRSDFDPRMDASVRVHISRLRQKLREYFEDEGRHQALRLMIPQGSHTLRVEEAEPEPMPEIWKRNFHRLWAPLLALFFASLCLFLWQDTRRTHAELSRIKGMLELPPVWKAILRPGRVTRIVYSIPVFYRWNTLRVRDVKVNHPDGWKTSPLLKPLAERFGEPVPSQSYAVSTDTLAAIRLTRFLSSHGVSLEVSPVGTLALEQYGSDNLIFLGIPPTNLELEHFSRRLNFRVKDGSSTVINTQPQEGEPALFEPQNNTQPGSSEMYGVFAALPGQVAGNNLLVLMGLSTSSIATLLSSPKGLEDLSRWWRAAGSPAYFEVVVRTVSEGVTTKTAEVAAFRPIL